MHVIIIPHTPVDSQNTTVNRYPETRPQTRDFEYVYKRVGLSVA